jgi:uncharacterized protein (DUF362 family)
MALSRRETLARLGFGAAFLSALALAPRSLLGSLLFEPDGEVVPIAPPPPNPFVRDGRALVAMVHGTDPAEMLREGLALLGGLDRLGVAGKRVLLKPNVVNGRKPPSTTAPEVVAAVGRLAKAAGASELVVADSSGMIRFPTRENLDATGLRLAAESVGAGTLALEEEPWVRVEPARAGSLRRYYVSKPVYEADCWINLPVVKTHRFAHYSCALKNLVGVVHPRYRPSLSFLSGDWHERIAELNLAVHPRLTIADATTVMVDGGPTSGTPARADLLLLSGDRIALDAVAVALLRSYGRSARLLERGPWAQRQIARAIELGLGVKGPGEMELVARSTAGGGAAFERLVERLRRDVGLEA